MHTHIATGCAAPRHPPARSTPPAAQARAPPPRERGEAALRLPWTAPFCRHRDHAGPCRGHRAPYRTDGRASAEDRTQPPSAPQPPAPAASPLDRPAGLRRARALIQQRQVPTETEVEGAGDAREVAPGEMASTALDLIDEGPVQIALANESLPGKARLAPSSAAHPGAELVCGGQGGATCRRGWTPLHRIQPNHFHPEAIYPAPLCPTGAWRRLHSQA